ncbi:MAG TPA: hypothetical protein VH253_04230 [Phycisphaerae bacterium]|nr:hypothetical protein [Phycisphaerae bacterium]
MAYTFYGKAAVETLIKTYKEAVAAVQSNKNPLKSSDLKKKADAAGKKVKEKLDADIAGIRQNAVTHFQHVDTFLGQCETYLKNSKEAYNKWLSSHADKDRDMATYAEGIINTTHGLAVKDADEYGKAWFEYRANIAAGVDPAYAGHFVGEVGKLVNEGKVYTGKIDKMGLLHNEAAALKKLVSTQHISEALDIEDHRKNADELLLELDNMLKKILDGKQTINVDQSAGSLSKYAANKENAIKVPLKLHEDLLGNMIASTKKYKLGVASMKKVYDMRIQTFSETDKKDDHIKTKVTAAHNLITTSEEKVKTAETKLQQATKDLETIRAFYKK